MQRAELNICLQTVVDALHTVGLPRASPAHDTLVAEVAPVTQSTSRSRLSQNGDGGGVTTLSAVRETAAQNVEDVGPRVRLQEERKSIFIRYITAVEYSGQRRLGEGGQYVRV